MTAINCLHVETDTLLGGYLPESQALALSALGRSVELLPNPMMVKLHVLDPASGGRMLCRIEREDGVGMTVWLVPADIGQDAERILASLPANA